MSAVDGGFYFFLLQRLDHIKITLKKKKELPHEVLIPSCQYISWWSSSNLSEHVRTKPGQVVAGTVSYPPEQGLSKDQVFELLKVPICSSACWAEKLCLAPQKC